jgi:uncharacterized protein YneR
LYKQAADLVISKDNGDVERKFWKDDFSVDSSSQYTGDVASYIWDTTNCRVASLSSNSFKYLKRAVTNPRFVSVVGQYDAGSENDRYYYINVKLDETSYIHVAVSGNSTTSTYRAYIRESGVVTLDKGFALGIPISTAVRIDIAIESDNVKFYANGSLLYTHSSGISFEPTLVEVYRYSPDGGTVYFKDLTVLPSISYADDFATDTVTFSTPSGSVEVANEYASRYTGV